MNNVIYLIPTLYYSKCLIYNRFYTFESKMAPLMAASMASSAVGFMYLLVCPVFSYIPAISFTKDKLLDIRQYTPPEISLVFDYSDVLLDIVVGGAAMLFRHFRTRRRGKRAGALVKLRQRRFGQHCLASI